MNKLKSAFRKKQFMYGLYLGLVIGIVVGIYLINSGVIR